MGELNSPKARHNKLEWPLIADEIEELEAGRADMKAVKDRVGCFQTVLQDEEFRIHEVGMVGGVAEKDLVEIKRTIRLTVLKRPSVGFLLEGIDLLPCTRSPSLVSSGLDQFGDLFRRREPLRFERRFGDEDGFSHLREVYRLLTHDQELSHFV